MARRRSTPTQEPTRWYRGAGVPVSAIRRFARQVAERFKPEKIILFGSHAYGRPHADSDVDVLVVMPCRNQIDQAYRIHMTIDPPFPVHVVVRTPYNMAWRLKEGESFLTEVVTKGRILYEAANAGMGPKGRSRLSVRHPARSKSDPRAARIVGLHRPSCPRQAAGPAKKS
ncbi:MAG TPA: nucleotidyltransferase domain-containing protein [Gemmataceae bacterium]|jgi:predicted nucleotidyltransferase|nr:nucleotidyltransferase domain-containing protein [Gemmataceae bacterium]